MVVRYSYWDFSTSLCAHNELIFCNSHFHFLVFIHSYNSAEGKHLHTHTYTCVKLMRWSLRPEMSICQHFVFLETESAIFVETFSSCSFYRNTIFVHSAAAFVATIFQYSMTVTTLWKNRLSGSLRVADSGRTALLHLRQESFAATDGQRRRQRETNWWEDRPFDSRLTEVLEYIRLANILVRSWRVLKLFL